MNRRARELGLRCTRFADSYGLNVRNRSCPTTWRCLPGWR